MKKYLCILGVLCAVVLLMSACSGQKAEVKVEQPAENHVKKAEATDGSGTDETADDTETAANDTIVVYFSREGEQYNVGVIEKGNTAIVADIIAEEKNADMFRLYPAVDNYPTTYSELTDHAKKEQQDNARPQLLGSIDDWDKYSTVYIGYPIWWGDMPMIVYTFLESYDMSGKTIIPFCTHEGSGISGTDATLKQLFPDAEVLDGLALYGSEAQKNDDALKQTVKNWLADK